MKVDKALVPLDGSPLAEMALPTAIELLRDSPDATLVLVRAVKARTLPGVDPTQAQLAVIGEAEAYLERVAARLRDQGRSRITTSVWYSGAAEAIVDAAVLRAVDLIVMSTHGRSGLRRMVLGSVAESVLRRTPTPILLVSAAGARMETRQASALTQRETRGGQLRPAGGG